MSSVSSARSRGQCGASVQSQLAQDCFRRARRRRRLEHCTTRSNRRAAAAPCRKASRSSWRARSAPTACTAASSSSISTSGPAGGRAEELGVCASWGRRSAGRTRRWRRVERPAAGAPRSPREGGSPGCPGSSERRGGSGTSQSATRHGETQPRQALRTEAQLDHSLQTKSFARTAKRHEHPPDVNPPRRSPHDRDHWRLKRDRRHYSSPATAGPRPSRDRHRSATPTAWNSSRTICQAAYKLLGSVADAAGCPGRHVRRDEADSGRVRPSRQRGRQRGGSPPTTVSPTATLQRPALWREMVLTNVLGPALLVRFALHTSRRRADASSSSAASPAMCGMAANLSSATEWAVAALPENTRLGCTRTVSA